MPQVVDALIVTLGLDPKNFNENQRQAMTSFRKMQEDTEKRAGSIEEQNRRVSNSVADLGKNALRAFALFSGGKGIVDFVGGMASADANLGRLSRNLGVSVNELAKWGAAAKLFGGSAEGMATSFTSLSDAFVGFSQGQLTPMISDFRAFNVASGATIEGSKSVTENFLEMAKGMQALNAVNPALAGWWSRRFGLDPGFFDAMLRGKEGMKEVLDYVQKIGVATEQDTRNALAFSQQLEALQLSITNSVRKSGVVPFATNLLNADRPDAFISAGLLNYIKSTANWAKNGKPGESAPDFSSFFTGGAGAKPLFSPPGISPFKNNAEREAYIRQQAAYQGLDPNVMAKVWEFEGKPGYVSDQGTSFGPFQLHYKSNIPGFRSSGLGDTFTKMTGLNANDPSTEAEQIKFTMWEARRHGLAAWHGWHGAPNAGGAGAGNAQPIVINNMTINTQATDAEGIVSDMRQAVQRRQSSAANSTAGQQ